MIKLIYSIFIICFLFLNCQQDHFEIKEGDLLFQKWTKSDFAKAINKVTDGYDNNDFAHIGLVVKDGNKLKVFEATQKNGVSLTRLELFVNASQSKNGKPQIAVGRLVDSLKNKIPQINDWVLNQLDKNYDTLFIYGNDKYYCSELIHDAFNTNAGEEIFTLQPMTFKDPDTDEYFPIWVDYFKKMNYPIPEGALGINPGGMSKSKKIDIVHEYFK